MPSGGSITRKKWWHGTLFIKNRDNDILLTELSTIDASQPNTNDDPNIFAYADQAVNCMDPVSIPVPAFLSETAPGYFLFRPTVEDLEDCIVDINTYQDAINLNNRRVFQFERQSAYNPTDIDCTATEPTVVDSFVYETIINNQNSNVFRYPVIPSYNQIGCCQVELSSVGTELPSSTSGGRQTRLWYILHNETTDVYSLVSYDFALLSTALVSRGNIDMSQAPVGTKLYDITWISVDNTLIVLASDGVRQLFPGSASSDAVLGDIINIQDINQDGVVFPVDQASNIKPCMEYNHYSNNLYVFTGKTVGTATSPVIYKLSYLNATFSIQQYAWLYTYPTLGELAFSSQNHAYVIIDSDLWNLDLSQSRFGTATPVYQDPPNSPTTAAPHLLGNMQTVNFAANPDEAITTNVLYSSNVIGQQFRVDTVTEATTLISGAIVGGSVVGSTTTLAGEDVRVLPFPFFPGKSPWLFMVDISSSMAGSKITKIKNALISFVRTYVRQGDKITVLWFRDSNDRITKDLVTYTDVNEIVNYINTNFVTASTTSNFCGAFANIAQDFNDLKNLIILSDGTFDDCGTTTAQWQENLTAAVNSIQLQNPQVVFRVIGVSAIDESRLNYIATASGGIYMRWNE